MPKRTDIKKILIIGSGPIIIGQACEFDYSGVQACKALRAEGYEIVLVNSNPATIMTDPEMADHTYVEPIVPEMLEKIIAREKPDAVLPTLGGQTALNVAVKLEEKGVFKKYNVEMIGANCEVIKKAEDRKLFKKAMEKIGMDLPKSGQAYNLGEAEETAIKIGFPVIIRPSFTMGGTGGGVAYNIEEFKEMAIKALDSSLINEILIEESVIGWKEFELEVMRDINDNVIIVCSIENLDPMGVHTGDSITVAPIQTLTDKEYQQMRNAAIKIIREIGVETGGSNVQFAVNPEDGKMVVIEMNPRVSRSSALASKATGFPIAKIAAKLAVGYTLDEISNDITQKTPACFEPTIDYCVVKIPRFNFEKFPSASNVLTTSMKAVGEVMSIGRTFKEALQKALRSMETGSYGLDKKFKSLTQGKISKKLGIPSPDRIFYIKCALDEGFSIEEIYGLSKIDRWFLYNIKQIVDLEKEIINYAEQDMFPYDLLIKTKKYGFSDRQIAFLLKKDENYIRNLRKEKNIFPTFRQVDTCGAEFEAYTPYYYSTYNAKDEDKITVSSNKKVMILGGGPNRIGQGIEFDYTCVHAAFALRDEKYESIMVNCNPETVSTDYDTSDRLYFEPLTVEDVLAIYKEEKPEGVIVQFGGQTPLNIAKELEDNGVNILGTLPESIHLAEDRERFCKKMVILDIPQPESGIARSLEEAVTIAKKIGYPLMVRPSFVLGGRGMEIIYDETMLLKYAEKAIKVSPEYPMLIDRFLEQAVEIEVDALSDGEDTFVAAIMEHIELAGVHSGDSACAIPTRTIKKECLKTIEKYTARIAKELKVVGLMNIQYAICDDKVYILEANPRGSRTVPFVSKVTGILVARIATQVMLGKKIKDFPELKTYKLPYVGVKEAVFSFNMFPEVDPLLGPEMRATGEVMGIANTFGLAFYKAQEAAGTKLPLKGNVLLTVADKDKQGLVPIARQLNKMGFNIYATGGTSCFLNEKGIESITVKKLHEGKPNITDAIKNKEINLIINTPVGRSSKYDDSFIRIKAIQYKVPYITSLMAAQASVEGIQAVTKAENPPKSLQNYYKELK